MATERYLDVRAMEPPEPLEMALEMVQRLEPGEYLRMAHRREPFPLYGLLTQDGFQYRLHSSAECPIELLIWRVGDSAAESAVNALLNPPV